MKILIDSHGVRFNTMFISTYYCQKDKLNITLADGGDDSFFEIYSIKNMENNEKVLQTIDDFFTDDFHVLDLRLVNL